MSSACCDVDTVAIAEISGTSASKKVAMPERLSEMVEHITEVARWMFNAAGASVILLSKGGSDPVFTVFTGKARKKLTGIQIGGLSGIAGWVVKNGEPIIVNDVGKDSRFDKMIDTVTGFTTRSVMCAPLIDGSRVNGVIEVVNKKDGTGFNEDELKMLAQIASIAVLPICFLEGEETRKELVALAVKSPHVELRMKIIDALARYRESGIPDILYIVNKSSTKQVRNHGLMKIKEI
jgi:GAF domain-containing protein